MVRVVGARQARAGPIAGEGARAVALGTVRCPRPRWDEGAARYPPLPARRAVPVGQVMRGGLAMRASWRDPEGAALTQRGTRRARAASASLGGQRGMRLPRTLMRA